MPGTTLYDPTDPLNVVSLRDHAHVSLVPNGTVIITRPARKRQTTVSAWARVQLAALVNGRYWPTRLIDGWGTISVDSTDADSEQHAQIPTAFSKDVPPPDQDGARGERSRDVPLAASSV